MIFLRLLPRDSSFLVPDMDNIALGIHLIRASMEEFMEKLQFCIKMWLYLINCMTQRYNYFRPLTDVMTATFTGSISSILN